MDFSSVRVPDPEQKESLKGFMQDLDELGKRGQALLLSTFPKFVCGNGILIAGERPSPLMDPSEGYGFVCSRKPDGDRIEYYFHLKDGTCDRCHFVPGEKMNETSISWKEAHRDIIERTKEIVSQPFRALDELRQFAAS